MTSLSVCLLLDEPAEQAVRRLWRQLAEDGLPSLTGHTHGRHVPHVTLAALRDSSWEQVRDALLPLPDTPQQTVTFQAFGSFTRSRCSLVPAPSTQLLDRHERVVTALRDAGIHVHRHYLPGAWLPHLTVATRTTVESLPRVARRVYEVLPLTAVLERAAVVDTTAGVIHPLARAV